MALAFAHPLAATAKLAERASRDARDPTVKRVARAVVAVVGERFQNAGKDEPTARETRWALAREALSAVQKYVRYEADPRETDKGDTYFTAAETWTQRAGDCDDAAPLLASIYGALGFRAKLVAMRSKKTMLYPNHVTTMLEVEPGQWVYAEPTIRGAALGEHPYAAGKRLGPSGTQRADGLAGNRGTGGPPPPPVVWGFPRDDASSATATSLRIAAKKGHRYAAGMRMLVDLSIIGASNDDIKAEVAKTLEPLGWVNVELHERAKAPNALRAHAGTHTHIAIATWAGEEGKAIDFGAAPYTTPAVIACEWVEHLGVINAEGPVIGGPLPAPASEESESAGPFGLPWVVVIGGGAAAFFLLR